MASIQQGSEGSEVCGTFMFAEPLDNLGCDIEFQQRNYDEIYGHGFEAFTAMRRRWHAVAMGEEKDARAEDPEGQAFRTEGVKRSTCGRRMPFCSHCC